MRNFKYLAINITAIIWGMIYFFIGVGFSFTLGSIGFWSGATVYLVLFLLPSPISVVAFWFSRTAGNALICCAAISILVAEAYSISSKTPLGYLGLCKFAGWHVPHIAFAASYLRQAKWKDYVGRNRASV